MCLKHLDLKQVMLNLETKSVTSLFRHVYIFHSSHQKLSVFHVFIPFNFFGIQDILFSLPCASGTSYKRE